MWHLLHVSVLLSLSCVGALLSKPPVSKYTGISLWWQTRQADVPHSLHPSDRNSSQSIHPLYQCFLPHKIIWITSLWLGGRCNRLTSSQHKLPKQLYHAMLPLSGGFSPHKKMKQFFHENYHLIHPDSGLIQYVSRSILKRK
jgi:hypothetical protein